MDSYLKKVKIYFSLIVLILMLGLTSGSLVLRDNVYLTQRYTLKTFNYWKYKVNFAYARSNDRPLSNQQNNQNAKSVPVLLYHTIIDEPDGENVLLKNFQAQMMALKRAGWQTVTIDDFYKFLQGEKNLPAKSLLLTFDDGAKESFYPVDPILKVLDYQAVLFIITKYSLGPGSGRNYYLSNKELKMLVKSGRWEIQSHGQEAHNFYQIDAGGNQGHFLSNKLWLKAEQRRETEAEFRARIYQDLEKSKNEIEQELAIKVTSFAFPFGDFGQNSKNFPAAESIILETTQTIYPLAFYQGGNKYSYNYPEPDSLMIKRIKVEPDWSGDDLLTVLENGQPKSLPYKSSFTKNDGWLKQWGKISFDNQELKISAAPDSTSASAILDGTYDWTNYQFKAQVRLNQGKTFSVLGRFKNNDNFIACVFSNNYIQLEQIVDGNKKIFGGENNNYKLNNRIHEVGIAVKDKVAACYLDGVIMIRGYYLDKNLNQGGIGFKIWNPKINNSELTVKEVAVEEIK